MPNDRIDRGGLGLADAVRKSYQAGQNDYSLGPHILNDITGKPIGRVEQNDAVIFCCRRGEREVELTEAFVDPEFDKFPRKNLSCLNFVILTLYHEKFKHLPVAFAPEATSINLGNVVSKAGLHQLRIAESEKFAHVTFFLNTGTNQPYLNEQDICIISPKGIAFDKVPQLSLNKVTDQILWGIEQSYDLIVTNFANGDVIGHTANNEAKVKCAEIIDKALESIASPALAANYTVIITADHGNLECMTQPDGSPHTAHTTNRVPFVLMEPTHAETTSLRDGSLANIAPTVLSLMGLSQPKAMSGQSLAKNSTPNTRKVLLIILDGWGIGNSDGTNPIYLAKTPYWESLLRQFPNCQLEASGEGVGLEAGKPGNSEAGHMNIGAGRVVLQDDRRLQKAITDGTFSSNPVFLKTLEGVERSHSNLHLIGLLSEKSSHGSIDYPLELLRLAKRKGLAEVYLHLIFDGRSTVPGSAPAMLETLNQYMNTIGIGKIATGIGRGMALDRSMDYSKIKIAYDALVFGKGHPYNLLLC